MLKGEIIAFISRRKAHDLSGSLKANLSATDALKIPNDKDTDFRSQDHEIATVPGYMS